MIMLGGRLPETENKRIETVFNWETKRLFTKWLLTGGGRLREVVAMRKLTVFIIHGYITNSQYDQLPVGLIAQLLEHCTSIAGVMGSNPVQAWTFSQAFRNDCLSCVNNCEGLPLFETFYYYM